jgi:hypothetical protein
LFWYASSFLPAAVVPALGTAQEASPSVSEQANTKGDDDWHVLFYLPAWIAGFKADVSARGRSFNLLVSNEDTLEFLFHNLRGLGLGHLEISKGRWGFQAEGIYLKLGDSASAAKNITLPIVPPVQIPVSGHIKVTAELSFNEAAVWYDFYRSSSRTGDQPVLKIEGLGGARYVYFRTKVDATLSGLLATSRHVTAQGKRDWVDPFVGGRLFWNLSDHWLFGFRSDLGGFSLTSDFSANLDTSIRYRFTDWLNLNIGYRGLYLNHEEGSFTFDGWIYGPWMGLGVEF